MTQECKKKVPYLLIAFVVEIERLRGVFLDGNGALMVQVRLHLGEVFRWEGCVHGIWSMDHEVVPMIVGFVELGALSRGGAFFGEVSKNRRSGWSGRRRQEVGYLERCGLRCDGRFGYGIGKCVRRKRDWGGSGRGGDRRGADKVGTHLAIRSGEGWRLRKDRVLLYHRKSIHWSGIRSHSSLGTIWRARKLRMNRMQRMRLELTHFMQPRILLHQPHIILLQRRQMQQQSLARTILKRSRSCGTREARFTRRSRRSCLRAIRRWRRR